jgi:hypothetical protein
MKTFRLPVAALALLILFGAGCRNQAAPPARTDQQISADIQAKLSGESALAGQNIQVAVDNGVATLSGIAGDPASRALAGNDAGSVTGVKTVVNNLTVQTAPAAAQNAPAEESPRERRRHHRNEAANLAQDEAPAPPPPAASAPAPEPPPQQEAVQTVPPAPAPPPAPLVKTVVLPAGTVVPVRIIDDLNSETAQANQAFHGTLAGDLIADRMIAIPQGAPVIGRVVDAKSAAHFKGSALLSLELTAIDTHNHQVEVVTDTFQKEGEGRGKNTAEKAGGGALLGTLIGALAGGGKGAAIGAVTGGGLGAGSNGITRGKQVEIQPETLVNFRLQSPVTVNTSRAVGSQRPPADQSDEPVLHQRPQ